MMALSTALKAEVNLVCSFKKTSHRITEWLGSRKKSRQVKRTVCRMNYHFLLFYEIKSFSHNVVANRLITI